MFITIKQKSNSSLNLSGDSTLVNNIPVLHIHYDGECKQDKSMC